MIKYRMFNPKATAFAAMVLTGLAQAAPSADEIKQLGTTLTPWGAEMAGNKEGTIPPYTGGIANPPKADYSTGVLPDPFASDKVQFTVDAKNMDKYADKLSSGLKEMLKKYPTFRLEVYPTRRSVSYPKSFLESSIKNASRCSLKDDGETLDVSQGCRDGIVFPIPKTGKEVMWNLKSAYMGAARLRQTDSYLVKPSGEVVSLIKSMHVYEESQLYDPNTKTPTRFWLMRNEYTGPTRLAGQSTLLFDSLEKNTRKSWSYQPSTKRVRLAPDLAADTPAALNGGAHVYDELNVFSGAMDRYDWKLVGKKEMFLPSNAYKRYGNKECSVEKMYTANFPNPSCVRWELRRVWHVQATLKERKRHVYGKRDFYLDEDTFNSAVVDNFDLTGKIYRMYWQPSLPDYVKNTAGAPDFAVFDLNSSLYVLTNALKVWVLDKPLPPSALTAESIQNHILGSQR